MTFPGSPHTPRPVDGTALAWELATIARPRLSTPEADRIHIAIGIGETFPAIDVLITIIAEHQIPLNQELATTVAAWLDCYRGQSAEPRLRNLLTEITHHSPRHLSAFEQRFGSALIAARDRRPEPTHTHP